MHFEFVNQEPRIPTLLGDKYQIVFGKNRDYYFPHFKIDGTKEQLEAIRECFKENVVNVVGPVKNGSLEDFLLEKENFFLSWHGTGENKRKYYKNELAQKKIYSQNGDLVIGGTLMITIDIEGKRGTIIVHDPSKGPSGIGMASGNSEVRTDPNDLLEKTISQLYQISRETACKEGFEEIGITVDPNLLERAFVYVNNPMFKEIVGELDNLPLTSNAPSNVIVVWRAHFVNEKAIEILNSIGINNVEFNQAFEGEGTIIYKDHNNTRNKSAEYEEISHHMFVPATKLTGVVCGIDKFKKDLRHHPLALIQTALGILRRGDWSNVPLVLDENNLILHEKTIPSDNSEMEGAWLKNSKEIKRVLGSKDKSSF